MKVDDALINRLAELSRLEFKPEEMEAIKKDLQNMLSFMDKLNKLDTGDVEPLIYVNDEVNVFRKDEVKDMLPKEDVLKNAPLKDSDYFKVPKVIQQDSE